VQPSPYTTAPSSNTIDTCVRGYVCKGVVIRDRWAELQGEGGRRCVEMELLGLFRAISGSQGS
jgi:hypothetical protein